MSAACRCQRSAAGCLIEDKMENDIKFSNASRSKYSQQKTHTVIILYINWLIKKDYAEIIFRTFLTDQKFN